jgi:hypothetical protein
MLNNTAKDSSYFTSKQRGLGIKRAIIAPWAKILLEEIVFPAAIRDVLMRFQSASFLILVRIRLYYSSDSVCIKGLVLLIFSFILAT